MKEKYTPPNNPILQTNKANKQKNSHPDRFASPPADLLHLSTEHWFGNSKKEDTLRDFCMKSILKTDPWKLLNSSVPIRCQTPLSFSHNSNSEDLGLENIFFTTKLIHEFKKKL